MKLPLNSNVELFRKLYTSAVINNKKSFLFNGQEVVTEYAKYLLESYDERNKK